MRRRKARVTDAMLVTPEIETLAAALRSDSDPAGAQQALAAFREARGSAPVAHRQRVRRQDDWRPTGIRSGARLPLRAVLGAALASVTLGGVALAAGTGVLGSVEEPRRAPDRTPAVPPHISTGPEPMTSGNTVEPSGNATDSTSVAVDEPSGPGLAESESASGSSATKRKGSQADAAALCHAWSQGNGARRGTAFERLADMAGGESAVDSYCAAVSEDDTADDRNRGKPTKTAFPNPIKEPPVPSPSMGRSAQHTQRKGKSP
ncbi:hypothetical protein [Streptomyces sp. NPDC060194]|uniref:hypothetical protein n=1 Tax=Streptomyces sp. NPDC060194 TaxID=3347069 RepID=UPI003665CEF1